MPRLCKDVLAERLRGVDCNEDAIGLGAEEEKLRFDNAATVRGAELAPNCIVASFISFWSTCESKVVVPSLGALGKGCVVGSMAR